ncbi:MAG: DJ-1/PfpI family protein, partial [Methanobacterium sp.]
MKSIAESQIRYLQEAWKSVSSYAIEKYLQNTHKLCNMNFGFLIFPGMEELDLVGPWEIVSLWSKFAKGPEKCLMVAENPGPVICNKGMSVNPHVTFADCPELDFLLVPGGEGTQREVENPLLIQFIAEQAEHCKAVLSVCTGTFILH